MGYPSIVGFAAHNLYMLADMFWVSRLGPEPVAAIAVFNAFFWVVDSVNQFAGAGSVSVISRRFGARDRLRTETAIAEAFLLKFLLGCAFMGLSLPVIPWIARVLGARDVVLEYTVMYGRILLIALPVLFPTWTVFTALRCISQPRTAMALMLASALLNAVLDPFLILGWAGLPRLGVAGAAWASFISFGLTVAVGFALFCLGAFPVRLEWAAFRRMHVTTMLQMLKIGIPAALGTVSFALGRLVVMPLLATFGAPAIAVYGVGNRVVQTAELVAVGISMGMAALIGQALGRSDKVLAWRTATHGIALGTAAMFLLALFVAIFARPLVRIFFDDPTYEALGVAFFRIHALAFPFIGTFVLYDGVFAGAGNTVPPMLIGAIHSWLLQIPLIWLLALPLQLGPQGAFWGLALGTILGAVLYTAWFLQRRWLRYSV